MYTYQILVLRRKQIAVRFQQEALLFPSCYTSFCYINVQCYYSIIEDIDQSGVFQKHGDSCQKRLNFSPLWDGHAALKGPGFHIAMQQVTPVVETVAV